MPDTHALLSPSSSERWINCPPSVRMSEDFEEKPSEYAAEGTAAHALCEYKLRQMLGYKEPDIRENLDYYNEEMENCTEEYRNYINELLENAQFGGPLMLVEQKIDFSRFVKGGFGTSDCIVIDGNTIPQPKKSLQTHSLQATIKTHRPLMIPMMKWSTLFAD